MYRGSFVPPRRVTNSERGNLVADTTRTFDVLSQWHWIAAAVHIVSAVVLLGLYLGLFNNDDERKGLLYSDTLALGGENVVTNKELAGSQYPIFWVLFPMPVITGLFHVCQAWLSSPATTEYAAVRYRARIQTGVNCIRWIEYAITASLMTWIVAQLSGITNIYLVWTLGIIMNVVLQMTGWLHELVNEPYARTRGFGQMNWVPMITGFVVFLTQWTIIACYFFRTVSASDDGAPAFVWVIFIGLFFTFLTFPLAILMFWGKFLITNWFRYEMAFIILSAISKLLLDWTLFGGIASG